MVSGGMTCIKYLLFCFNLIFAISGVAILAVGTIIHIVYFTYSPFVDPSFQSAPIVLMIVGVIVFIVAFFGCCGAVRENHCMVITFSTLLLIIFSLELAAGIAGYVRRTEVEDMLDRRLNDTMYEYYNQTEVTKSWDVAQHEMNCCGMNGPKDWVVVSGTNMLPHTCCPDTPDDGSCSITTPDHYTDPCLGKLKTMFRSYAAIIGGVGVGIGSMQLIGVAFACLLARSIRKEYETV